MRDDRIEGEWRIVKGWVREQWGRLTDDDLDIIDGQLEQLVGRIQERYGFTKEQADREVREWKARQQNH